MMVRVLNVIGMLHMGGAETTIMSYYRHMCLSKVQFDFLLTAAEKGHYEEKAISLGARIFRRPMRTKHPILNALMLYRVLKAHKDIGVVHFHTASSVFAIDCFIARFCGVSKIILYSSSELTPPTLIQRIFRPLARIAATHMAAGSTEAGVSMFGEKAKDKLIIVPRARELESFRYNRDLRKIMREELGISNCHVILNVGRMVEQKNQLFLLESFKLAAEKDINLVLLIAGEGFLRSTLETRIDELGIRDSVRLPGNRDDIPALMQATDLFVLPSLYEGLPGAAVEAQAAGLPCLLADTVSPEASIIPEAEFLPITQGVAIWSQRMLATRGAKRYDTMQQMQDAGYDIRTAARMLEELYLA
jgi:glycosyltransferase involved in cell wall biosynthesis